ncbi:hypothetical protein N7326_09095 [Corynebacterium sp. ES2794-CONJ1]|uniref:hypothetical protein n=1 Tax=unclassified Corynebacterium TaxID=2624378 RepID=UPI002168F3B5|nr:MULTISPECIES: hypothetical protein [unclassified Corynebacterium]MCS4490714.1 hypothetical protein [Corynebacterium sp. ES2775-CONJ]MCU9520012.1 hypothetical protein [Corynebacterium sp. ES2794-CONJ1]
MRLFPIGILSICCVHLAACTGQTQQIDVGSSTSPVSTGLSTATLFPTITTAPTTKPDLQPVDVDPDDPKFEGYRELYDSSDRELIVHDFCDHFNSEELAGIGLRAHDSSETERNVDLKSSVCYFDPIPEDRSVEYQVLTGRVPYEIRRLAGRVLHFDFEGRHPRIYFYSDFPNGESSVFFQCIAATSTTNGTINLTTEAFNDEFIPDARFNDAASTCQHSHDKLIELINLSGVPWP